MPAFRFSLLLLLALMLFSLACAEAPYATVNGEALSGETIDLYLNKLHADYGVTDPSLLDDVTEAYLKDLALQSAIEDMLLRQDMVREGFYTFDEETEAWLTEAGEAAYESALLDVGEMIRETLELNDVSDADLREYALLYAQRLGVSSENYVQVFRDEYARLRYEDWLLSDTQVTQEEIEAAYASRVETDTQRYAEDIPAYETALENGETVYYTPEGYRGILQIYLRAEGESDEEKLASVKATLEEITSRLAEGEDFEALIARFGEDTDLTEEVLLASGYPVHALSVRWDDSFRDAAMSLASPGEISDPIVSAGGVHILQYARDLPAGPVPLSDALSEEIGYDLHVALVSQKTLERLDVLASEAEIVFSEDQ
ncbi:MAG: peptidylprolyl isomerase [Clostridia bacterium]|nr:peptidylprolyl isomerase [Clostridia bacterium]